MKRRETSHLARKAWVDLAIVCLSVACAAVTLPRLNAFEWLTLQLQSREHMQLDDMLLTLGVALVMVSWFSFRRWHDAREQLRALREAEIERERHLERVQWLSAQLLDAEEQERQKLADTLHDGVVQTLYACRLKLELYAGNPNEPSSKPLLDEAMALVDQSMERTRDLTLDLTPPILHDLGLREALDWLQQQCGKQFGVVTDVEATSVWNEIPVSFHLPVFHSVRELIINASKHARASRIAVSACAVSEDRIHVDVMDDGCGFDTREKRNAPGFGLFSIERRLSCVGGKLDLQSRPGRTIARLVLPRSALPTLRVNPNAS